MYNNMHRDSLIRGLTQGNFCTFTKGGALLQALLGDFDGHQTTDDRPFTKLDLYLRDIAQGTSVSTGQRRP